MEPCLLLAVKELTDSQRNENQLLRKVAVNRLVLRVADAVPDDRVHRRLVGGHEGCRHLLIVRVGLEHPVGCLLAEVGELHVAVIVGNGQPLVLRARLCNLQHAVDGVLRLIEAQGPETDDDPDRVIGPGHLKGFCPVRDRLGKVREDLGGDPVHRFGAADARPGGDGPLHGRKTQEVIVVDRLQDREKCLRPAAVRILADGLAHALLQPCGNQKSGQQLMKLRVFGLYDPPDERHGDDHGVVVAEDRLPDGARDRLIPAVNPCRQDILELDHVQVPRAIVIALEVEELLIDGGPVRLSLGQVGQRRQAVNVENLVRLHESEGVQHMGCRIRRPHGRPEQGPRILKMNKLIQHIVEIIPVLRRHQNVDDLRAFLIEDLPQALLPRSRLYIFPPPPVDDRKTAVRIIAEISHRLQKFSLLFGEPVDFHFAA